MRLLLIILITSFNLSTDNCSKSFETYVKYEKSLEIYDSPEGEIIEHFRFEDDPNFDFGKTVVFDTCIVGWFRIEEIKSDLDQSSIKGRWIKSSSTEIGTRNYDNSEIALKESPHEHAKQVGVISEESYLEPLAFCNGWVLLESNGSKGWLSPDWICTSAQTNCN